MPTTSHMCPKCTDEDPCFFTEGEIVSLKEDLTTREPLALWTGIVLEAEKDQEGRVYRVLWGAPAMNANATTAARHSGEHRHEELQRFLVPPIGPGPEMRTGGGGGKEGLAHRFEPVAP